MNDKRTNKSVRLWLVLAILAVAVGGSGCATTNGDEPDNASSKPWNSPEGWQNGNLPSNMFH
jgi:hypothetical protein